MLFLGFLAGIVATLMFLILVAANDEGDEIDDRTKAGRYGSGNPP